MLTRRSLLYAGTALAADPEYVANIERWRRDYEADLRSETGWLTLTGLHWLREGDNTVEAAPGFRFTLAGGRVTLHDPATGPRALTPNKDSISRGDLTLQLLKRGDRFAVRVRDRGAHPRKDFAGAAWFPVDPAWRVEAKWRAYPQPVERLINTVVNTREPMQAPGVAEFTIKGAGCQLEPVLSEGKLFFIFRDLTAGKSTYAAGRFLDAPIPRGTTLVLEFNQAYNPPCAYTPYATCPLPPRRNHLPVAVEAGEKKPLGTHLLLR